MARDADEAAASESLRESERGRALVTARFEAHTPVAPGDLAELAVRTERLAFFDLETGRRSALRADVDSCDRPREVRKSKDAEGSWPSRSSGGGG